MANSIDKPTEEVQAKEQDKTLSGESDGATGNNNEDDCDLYEDIDESVEVEKSEPSSSSKNKTSLSELFCSPVKEFESAPGSNLQKTQPEGQKRTSPRKTKETVTSASEDVDLYEDLDQFEEHANIKELQERLQALEDKYASLEAKNQELEMELASTQRKNIALQTNISSLYKTAKLEIERKERQRKEMQQRYDSMVFRRGSSSKGPQRPETNVEKLSKEFAQGRVFEVERETECTIRMANTSICFSVESEDFRKQRIERLTELTNRPVQARPVLVPPESASSKETELEEGEVEEKEETPAVTTVTTSSTTAERQERPPRKRSRSRDRNKSPVAVKTVVRSPSRRRCSPRVMPVKEVEPKGRTPRKNSHHRSGRSSPPRASKKRTSSNPRANLRRR